MRRNDEYTGTAEAPLSAEEFFGDKLGYEEKLIWCARQEEKTTLRERGGRVENLIGPAFGVVFALAMIIPCLIYGSWGGLLLLPFLIVPAILFKKELKPTLHYYAVTDQRIIGYDGKELYSVKVGSVRSTYVEVSERGIGSVLFNRREVEALHRSHDMGTTYEKRVIRDDGGFYGIKDPQMAADLIMRASDRAREKEKELERRRR